MLTSKQRAYLKSLSNPIDTILIVGKDGVTPEVVTQARTALAARELIKCKILETTGISVKEVAAEIAESTRAEIVLVIGNKFILYKKNGKDPKIKLPVKRRIRKD